MELIIIGFFAILGLLVSVFLRYFVEFIPEDPKHIGLLVVFGRRAEKDDNGNEILVYKKRGRLFGFLPIDWVGFTPGLVLDHGYYIVMPMIHNIIKVQATIFDIDVGPVELTTQDEITAPFHLSIDYAADPKRLTSFLDRRVDGEDEREKNKVIEQKIIDAFVQTARVVFKELTLEQANALNDREFNKLMLSSLCGIDTNTFNQLWPAGRVRAEEFRKLGVPDALGLGVLVHLVTFERVTIPQELKQALAETTRRSFKLRASITEILLRYAQESSKFASFLKQNGFFDLLMKQGAIEAKDINKILDAMAQSRISIPKQTQKYWEELAQISEGKGQIVRIRGQAFPFINLTKEKER